jgi:hypothetical protein
VSSIQVVTAGIVGMMIFLGFLTLFQRFGVFFVVKCPAADAADAPQP